MLNLLDCKMCYLLLDITFYQLRCSIMAAEIQLYGFTVLAHPASTNSHVCFFPIFCSYSECPCRNLFLLARFSSKLWEIGCWPHLSRMITHKLADQEVCRGSFLYGRFPKTDWQSHLPSTRQSGRNFPVFKPVRERISAWKEL